MSPLAWSFLAGAASSLLFTGALLAAIMLLRDRRAPTRHLPPSFQSTADQPRLELPSARAMQRRRDTLNTSLLSRRS